MFSERFEVMIAVEQTVPALDTSRRDGRTDGLADSNATLSQRAVILRCRDHNIHWANLNDRLVKSIASYRVQIAFQCNFRRKRRSCDGRLTRRSVSRPCSTASRLVFNAVARRTLRNRLSSMTMFVRMDVYTLTT